MMNPMLIILKRQIDKTIMYIDGSYVTSFEGKTVKYVQQWLKKNIQNFEVKIV